MKETIERMTAARIVPVVKIDDPSDAIPLARALIEGGLPLAEITFRTPAAEGAINAIAREFPQMLLGAGTLLSTEQVDRAKEAGAKFFVSPGFNETTALYCKNKGFPFIPGAVTPSEIERAISLGFDFLKFFPAQAAGGVKMIKALSAPYFGVKFMPTGGINLENLNDYLSLPSVFACGGSFMVASELLKEKRFDLITEVCRETVNLIRGENI